MSRRRFEVILIKPSHYDDDGYVIQWVRSLIPSNTLAALHGLFADCAGRRVLGAEVDIVITAIDETNTRVRAKDVLRRIQKAGGFGMVGLVGVQSNQFPRTLDIARPLRAAGVPVVIGGFHVSGCLAMLPEMDPDLQRALDMGCALYAGEAEGRLDEVLIDAAGGRLKPVYDYLKDLPGIDKTPVPYMPSEILRRNLESMTTFDAGRGCPFQCSFCTIINVQGKKSRRRSPDDIEEIIRRNVAQGIVRFFITDDNFARNKDWEAILDRVIHLREVDGFEPIRLTIQVDTQCHRIPNFIEKCRRANVFNMFVGLENINPDTLIAMKKRQNKIAEYRALFLAAKKARIITLAGYILGFPNDTPESVLRDIEIIKRELPVDVMEFMLLTPLPGSEDHQKLAAQGGWMDPDLNKYDLTHVVARHPTMSKEQWEDVYRRAWDAFYTPEHMETVIRRNEAFGLKYTRVFKSLVFYHYCVAREGVHPMDGGLLRIKSRRDRRPGLPLENPLLFYPRVWWEAAANTFAIGWKVLALEAVGKRISADPARLAYMDKALTPATEEDDESYELLARDEAARAAVKRYREVQRLTVAAGS